jgi:hypothetical protein
MILFGGTRSHSLGTNFITLRRRSCADSDTRSQKKTDAGSGFLCCRCVSSETGVQGIFFSVEIRQSVVSLLKQVRSRILGTHRGEMGPKELSGKKMGGVEPCVLNGILYP